MASRIHAVESVGELRAALAAVPAGDLGFVPTMGALHAGHAALVRRARAESKTVVVSVFVNPTQFNDPKDLETYPRTREADLALLERAGADLAWFPKAEEIYADRYRYQVQENDLSLKLCGMSRPGHFTGMLTVVMKLLQATGAGRAYFGEKDFQQLELVRGMAQAFFLPTEIIACPIERDEAGLALSSRNARLSPEGVRSARAFAAELSRTGLSLDDLRARLESLPVEKIDYLEDAGDRRYAAVFIEGVRLIDNRSLRSRTPEVG